MEEEERQGYVGKYLGITAVLISIAGAIIAVEERYAHAEDLKQLKIEFKQNILENKIERLQERIWKIEDRGVKTNEDRDVLRRLESEKTKAEQQLQTLESSALK